ncbi:transmembrane protein 125 isoform X1 [Carcharodon carcharias]|uniref:transmembrane protein 125 isoform X1 n=1 Tax=Carcharodon carcharias TaxID=13397 RepID=UPI001B7F2624|nr:transmembrane protein 125 isoform X1 [Carcharodon carcharias]XP_041064547.1 transmembrane protein 125 isoform X1 [Carcharodon carcharias]XP_041064550.1 transmembrane protein 125 isoform X1 [Carcharodon carcharias]XP_041064551.1 transmembrane protein 125 isoform X1 [Carcharodon carcharias]
MSELSEFTPGRFPTNRSRIQQSILEDQMELWWFQDVKRSILCYFVALILILGTGVGGIVLISTVTSKSGVWRLGVGIFLCLLTLVILFKHLMTSAIQDMNCVRSRAQIDRLRSGGLIDYLVILFTGFMILTSGYVLIIIANADSYPSRRFWNDMLIAGVTLTVAGFIILLSFFIYVIIFKLCPHLAARSMSRRVPSVYIISEGNTEGTQRGFSSTANLI